MTDTSSSVNYELKVATKGLFFNNGEVLIVADPDGKWDFPGGGVEPPEKLEDGFRREVKEELGIEEFEVGDLVHVDEWFIASRGLHVIGIFYRVDLEVRPSLILSHEHSETAWIKPEAVSDYDVTNDTSKALKVVVNGKQH